MSSSRSPHDLLFALEQKTSIQILLYLLDHDNVHVTSIFRSGHIRGGQTAFYTALERLESSGLISSYQLSPRSYRLVSLTPLGKKIAFKLQEIIKIYISF